MATKPPQVTTHRSAAGRRPAHGLGGDGLEPGGLDQQTRMSSVSEAAGVHSRLMDAYPPEVAAPLRGNARPRQLSATDRLSAVELPMLQADARSTWDSLHHGMDRRSALWLAGSPARQAVGHAHSGAARRACAQLKRDAGMRPAQHARRHLRGSGEHATAGRTGDWQRRGGQPGDRCGEAGRCKSTVIKGGSAASSPWA